ncbi:MAG: metallophosphoesterase [Pseudomonadota bacterium]
MSATGNRRIYALGDIHGMIAALDERLDEIQTDLAARPHAAPLLICLGDYVDRGPDSRAVIETLIEVRNAGWIETVFLLGNHDKLCLDFLSDPTPNATDIYHWLDAPLGGSATVASYGVHRASSRRAGAAHASFVAAIPPSHRSFLETARLHFSVGTYLFVHAGIRPGVALANQDPDDLIWIRDPFLHSTDDHGQIVVHGHTVVGAVAVRPNRIGIDTGAVFGGTLSCLVLEDDTRALLAHNTLHPLTG